MKQSTNASFSGRRWRKLELIRTTGLQVISGQDDQNMFVKPA